MTFNEKLIQDLRNVNRNSTLDFMLRENEIEIAPALNKKVFYSFISKNLFIGVSK
jgi:hypothetical protein